VPFQLDPWERYQGKIVPFYDEWLEEVGRIPGVRASGLTTQFPPMVFMRSRLAIDDRTAGAEEELFAVYDTVASAGVFDALGMKLVRGRLFDDRDTSLTPPIVVVNQALAARFFANEDPLGRRIRTGEDPSQAPWVTIVGIVSDARNRGLDHEASPELWSSYRQQGQWSNQMHLVVRTEEEPRSIVPLVRERLGALDPDLSAYAVQTLEERFDTVVFTRRFASVAMAVLAFMSLVLAAMGLYGVIAFLVGERRRELGLRIALGADSRKLVGHVLGEALNLVGVGVALGLAGAFALTRFLSAMLFQVAPHDPASMAATVVVTSWWRCDFGGTVEFLVRSGRNSESLQPCGDVGARGRGLHFFVDVEDLAVRAHVVRPPKRKLPLRRNHPVGFRNPLLGIAQDRIVD